MSKHNPDNNKTLMFVSSVALCASFVAINALLALVNLRMERGR